MSRVDSSTFHVYAMLSSTAAVQEVSNRIVLCLVVYVRSCTHPTTNVNVCSCSVFMYYFGLSYGTTSSIFSYMLIHCLLPLPLPLPLYTCRPYIGVIPGVMMIYCFVCINQCYVIVDCYRVIVWLSVLCYCFPHMVCVQWLSYLLLCSCAGNPIVRTLSCVFYTVFYRT